MVKMGGFLLSLPLLAMFCGFVRLVIDQHLFLCWASHFWTSLDSAGASPVVLSVRGGAMTDLCCLMQPRTMGGINFLVRTTTGCDERLGYA